MAREKLGKNMRHNRSHTYSSSGHVDALCGHRAEAENPGSRAPIPENELTQHLH